MKNTSLKNLLKTLTRGKVTPSDFQQLREQVSLSSDNDLQDEIGILWEETSSAAPMDANIKREVLTTIHRQIKIAPKRSFRWTRIASAILLPLLIAFGSYYYFSTKHISVPQEFVVMAENGQKTKVLLPDGTQVWLNSDSRLSYSSDFNAGNRKVKLEGEAFFDVTKSTEQRFTVEAASVNVVVYGTVFNVSAYNDEPTIDISLLSGSIGVENNQNNQLLAKISPNQLISVSKKDLHWDIQSCDAQMESLWTQNILKFENAPAEEVFRKLGRWYGMKISIENIDADIRYGFTLKSESLREMLDEINKITPITYKVNGEEVHIIYR